MAEASPVFPDIRARVVPLPTSNRVGFEPFCEARVRNTAASPLAQPVSYGIRAQSFDQPRPLLSVSVGEHLVADQVEVFLQAQGLERRRMGPEERPQLFRQAAPPHASGFARDLAKTCWRQSARTSQPAFAAASETAATSKERSRATDIHRSHYRP